MTDPRALSSALSSQRRQALSVIDDLPDADLRRPVLPSGWTLLGLVSHLTWDVERFWFGAVLAGDAGIRREIESRGDAWQVPADATRDAVLEDYRSSVAASDEIVAATPATAAPRWWPDFFADYRLRTVVEVQLHVLVETATHVGHLDAARELIDGRQRLVLT